MKKFLLALCALCLLTPLTACTGLGTLGDVTTGGPVVIANQTKVDEQLALSAELGYKAWMKGVEIGISSGYIKGSVATKVAAVDNKLYSALQTVEQAYTTGNSASILAAVGNFNATLASANATLGSK
jgi:hypothetical protein